MPAVEYKKKGAQLGKLFSDVVTKTDCDIVSVECGHRMPFFFDASAIRQGLKRGTTFEICYGSMLFEHPTQNRKMFLNHAMSLTKITKGKGIFLSAEANRRVFMRSPLDVV